MWHRHSAPTRAPTCRKLADTIRHGEDGGHGADVGQREAQLLVGHHRGRTVGQAASREVEGGVPVCVHVCVAHVCWACVLGMCACVYASVHVCVR